MILEPGKDSVWLDELIERYERLTDDLKRIRRGEAPSPDELVRAKHAATSDVVVLNLEHRWARTLSRFYRLGDRTRAG